MNTAQKQSTTTTRSRKKLAAIEKINMIRKGQIALSTIAFRQFAEVDYYFRLLIAIVSKKHQSLRYHPSSVYMVGEKAVQVILEDA